MKSINNDILTIYVNKKINIDFSYESIEKYLKDLVINLNKKNYEIKGFYDVNIYKNDNYGLIIDFIKKESDLIFDNLIDLKLHIYYDSLIYLEIDDYFLIKKYKNIYYYKNKYYLNINNVIKKDLIILSEFCNYIYGEKAINLSDKLFLL